MRIEASKIKLKFFASKVACGFPSPAQDYVEKELSLDEILHINAPQTYIVQAQGDSMQGAGIYDGDLLIVDRAVKVRSGQIVVAAINGDVFVKRFYKKDELIILHSENPNYPPRYIVEGDELDIWGVVQHSIRSHQNG